MLGLYDTWHAFAQPDQRLRDALSRELKALAVRSRAFLRRQVDRLERLVRRLLGKPRVIHLRGSAFGAGAVATGDLTGYKWENLPKTNTAKINELERRVKDILDRVVRLESKQGKTESEMEKVRGELAATTRALRARDEQVAITGVPIAVFGLALVGIGLLFQLVAEVVG
jgi:hypothetical protein